MKHNNLRATAILAIMADLVNEDSAWERTFRDAMVSPYVNGRESGFSLRVGTRSIAFAENRNSDSTVVYPGYGYGDSAGVAWDSASGLSESAYANAQHFESTDYYRTAMFIILWLTNDGTLETTIKKCQKIKLPRRTEE